MKNIAITNVHLDLGAGRRGTDMGPSAIHVAKLIPRLEKLGHSIESINTIGSKSFEALQVGEENARFLEDILKVCARLKETVQQNLKNDSFPLILGGDHSQAIGTISGITSHFRKEGKELGVIWIDAHADMNTPSTSPSGNIHGMPLSILLGDGHPKLVALNGEAPSLRPENVAVIGARDIDPVEAKLVRESGIAVYTMSEIDKRGAAVCFQEAIDRVSKNSDGIHLSFDLDGVDPREAPGVGTPVPGGLSLRESHLICEMLCETGRLVGMEMVELNPTLDIANQTGKLAVWLIQSALGKRII
jgi:arginase